LEHDLFGKPASTFPDHALGGRSYIRLPALPTQPGGMDVLNRLKYF
jgi:hypothetical protein